MKSNTRYKVKLVRATTLEELEDMINKCIESLQKERVGVIINECMYCGEVSGSLQMMVRYSYEADFDW